MKRWCALLLTLVLMISCSLALADDWTCLSCGNAASGNFCNNCGSAKPSDDWTCAACGNAASGKFCNNCGAARSDNASIAVITETPAPTATPAPTSTPVPCESTGEGYIVNKEYRWDTSRYHYFAMVIQNTSGAKCGFDVQVIYYDANNNTVGVSNPSINVCDSGYEVLVTCSSDTAFDHVGYTIKPTSSSYNDVHSYVNVTAEISGNKAILMAENTGTVAAQFVEYRCLFLNDADEVVGSGWGYLVDNASELKSGSRQYREESCSESFSSVVVYFEGRTNRSQINTGTVEIDTSMINVAKTDEFEVTKEYSWESSRYQSHAFVVKNTSAQACGFEAQIVYYDKDNKIVSVSNPSINVCGSGYEVLIKSSSNVKYDHMAYIITPTKTSYADVHDSVTVTASVSGKKAILTATNNGSQTAKFVEYNCLFLDDAGNVVGTGWGYLVDKKSELKPGATEIREEKCSAAFSDVIVFFEGRRSK